MKKKIDTKAVIEKRIELVDSHENKITNQKKSWSQIRKNMQSDINEETYSYEYINFIFKI
jgi:hypothetical protein